jgi:hypothetical protein
MIGHTPWRGLSRLLFVLAALGAAACAVRDTPPLERTHDARFGFFGAAPARLDKHAACGLWSEAVSSLDHYAASHTSFPNIDPDRACFIPITHAGRKVAIGHVPPNCPVPKPHQRESMRALADRLEKESSSSDPEPLFPCNLTPAQRTAAALHNARVLRRVAALPSVYPYSAILVPGWGIAPQAEASMASWLPGDACHGLSEMDRLRLGSMVPRTQRAADAWRGGVAPMILVTGGTPHSPMIEAFGMLYLLQCGSDSSSSLASPSPPVLLEPCAEHTHTNLRNSGRWLVAMGARTGYLVTDDGLQSDYFQDGTIENVVAGSLDARSLRDWGYVVGSWRQASVGVQAGFWFTPFRFWAEPEAALGSFTCVMTDGH